MRPSFGLQRHLQRFLAESRLSSSSASIRIAVPRAPRSASPAHLSPNHLLAPAAAHQQSRPSSSSSTRWKTRQSGDHFAREARVSGLKSRAAYKLLELDRKHHLFGTGQTVIDLGYAPGSWSQVAVNRTSPGGRVVGIDVIPAQPPRGASSIQGNFLSEAVRDEVRAYVREYGRGRVRVRGALSTRGVDGAEEPRESLGQAEEVGAARQEVEDMGAGGYIDLERRADLDSRDGTSSAAATVVDDKDVVLTRKQRDEQLGRVVDVVLSDMSAPWEQTTGMWIRSVSNPYYRMMNTSGMAFRDHAGSMDLCLAALTFCYDTLRTGGHFLCKFYQGGEDKAFETKLRKLFEKVYREKPESSRSESKEAYFVALRRKANVERESICPDGTFTTGTT